MRGADLLAAARSLLGHMARNPGLAFQQYFSLAAELTRIATGRSELAPAAQDKRFADSAWKESLPYRALAQAWLAWGRALNGFIDEAGMDKRDAERARFVVRCLSTPWRPPTRSAATRRRSSGWWTRRRQPRARAGELRLRPGGERRPAGAGGQARVRGGQEPRHHARRGGVPQPGDGADPVSAGRRRYARPLLIAPPQINKFYVFDLAPDKSIVQLARRAACRLRRELEESRAGDGRLGSTITSVRSKRPTHARTSPGPRT